MQPTDVVSFAITIAGTLSVFFYLPYLLPCNVVDLVKDALNETLALLRDEHLPRADEHRVTQAILTHKFALLRTTSHRAAWLPNQLWIAIRGTTWKLYALLSSIRAFQREMEVLPPPPLSLPSFIVRLTRGIPQLAIDGHQLATLDNAQRAVGPAQAAPGNDVAAPAAETAEPAPPAPPPA
ncbi:hypothetical protein F5148DRAFT_1368089 [Russula earlei]|uniref:Uncharacterized protein n=1 Tax=Russula earlei TaxID=71964 RepID=A0ACC0U9Y7_9AGAM|nr:hypothetical protein F5148DRAFT_1368089 [Russula earlei]